MDKREDTKSAARKFTNEQDDSKRRASATARVSQKAIVGEDG